MVWILQHIASLKDFTYIACLHQIWVLYDNRDSSHNRDIYVYMCVCSRIAMPQNLTITYP